MDAREFLGLEATHNPTAGTCPVVPGLSTGGGFLFGGCGLGAAIAAMEGATGRPVVWATAQYLSYATAGRRSSTSTSPSPSPAARSPRPGPSATSATARSSPSTPRSGTRDLDADRPVGRRCPTCRRPTTARPRTLRSRRRRVDHDPPRPCAWPGPAVGRARRQAAGRRPLGAVGPHARPARRLGRRRSPSSATTCRSASARRSGAWAGGNSLDNTLRVVRLVPTEWVLRRHPGRRRRQRLRPRPRCTCGPRTAPCWPPPASPPSCGTGTSRAARRSPDRSGRPPDDEARHDRSALRHDHPVRRVPLARAARLDRRARRPRLHRRVVAARPTAPTPSRRWRWRRCGRRRCGSARPSCPAYTRGPATLAQCVALAGRRGAGPVRVRHRHVVQRHRRALERHRLRRAVPEGARHGALPARGAHRREGHRGLRHVLGQGFRLGIVPEQPVPDPDRRAARGHAAPGRPRGRRRHHQLAVGRRRAPRWRPSCTSGRRRGRQGDRGPHLRGADRPTPTPCGPWAATPSPPTSPCPSTPSSTGGWAGATRSAGMWELWAEGDRKAALAAIPDERRRRAHRVGHARGVPRAHPALRRQRRHHPGARTPARSAPTSAKR